MTTKTYRAFNLIVDIAGHRTFFLGLVAVDVNAALADVIAAYGEGELVQWGHA